MAFRISGINIPDNKKVSIALTYIFGIGSSVATKVLKTANVDPEKRVKDLSIEEQDKIRSIIEKTIKVEGDLKREVLANIKRLSDIGSYRGSRHKRNLPARGQRTKTNARTKRGKKVTVGSGRRKVEKT